MAHGESSRFCKGMIKLNMALLFVGIVDTIVAVCYLVSIASAFSKSSTNEEKLSGSELVMKCFVPIVSFTAVFLLSLGVMIHLGWLLIFHLAKSVILIAGLGLKSILDIYEIVSTGDFELFGGASALAMAAYCVMEIWFFFVVRKAYIAMVKSDGRRGGGGSNRSSVFTDDTRSNADFDERSKLDDRCRIHAENLSSLSDSRLPSSLPNCYYEIPQSQRQKGESTVDVQQQHDEEGAES